MRDRTTAYSMSFTKRHWGPNRLRILEFVNAGFLYVGADAFDLDFIEWFLGQDTYRKYFWVIEQTAWAAIGGRVQPTYFDHTQVAFPTTGTRFGKDWVALHFISPLRHRLEDATFINELHRRSQPFAESVITLRTEAAIFLDPIRDFTRRLVRRLMPPRWKST
jgi:hypothetical protein